MARISLSDLVRTLGPTVVRVLCAPGGLDHPVGEPELLDAADPTPSGPAALLLGIGLRVDEEHLADLTAVLGAAARAEAAALVIKCRNHSPDRLVELAQRSGVAVLDAQPDLPWRRLEALCATVLRGEPGPAPAGLAEVPHGDLFALANAVAAIAGGAAAIMDTNHVIIAYSSLEGQRTDDTRRRSILSRRVPEDALPSFLAPTVWNSRSVERVKRPGDMDRLAVVVRAGSDVLGSLWVAVEDSDDRADRSAALMAAAKLAAPHLLQLRRHAGAEQERRNEALRTTLEADADASGLDLPGHLLTLAAAEQADPTRRRLSGLQVEDMVTLDAATFGLAIATTLAAERLYVLVPSAGGGQRQAELFARHVVDRAKTSLRKDFLGVLGAEVSTAAGLRAQQADGNSALTHLTRTGHRSGVVGIDSVRADLVLHRVTALVAERADLRSGMAERIRAHDADRGTRYADSLRGYLRSFGDIATAAERLHIHQNTLRHRLRRAEQLFDLDLRNPERLLLLWLELTALA
jgi:hypothetical protein